MEKYRRSAPLGVWRKYVAALLCAGWIIVIAAACSAGNSLSSGSDEEAEKQQVTAVVENFGKTLQKVSLTEPQEFTAESIEKNYSEYLTSQLLEQWKSDPQSASETVTSDLQLDRIEITDIKRTGDGEYSVSGDIVEITGNDSSIGQTDVRYPRTLRVIRQDNRWLIAGITKIVP